jgi:23S rRNA pseudouridine2605 synthase
MRRPAEPAAVRRPANGGGRSRHGLARILSKRGLASRTEAARWIAEGRVRVNGRLVRDPEFPVIQGIDEVVIDGRDVSRAARIVVMLNKPRGLVTTVRDEQGRATVYECLEGSGLPWLAPVGRLDKASEGLLLFSNDPSWAAQITSPATGPDKTYHVQIDGLADESLLANLARGMRVDGELLSAKSARRLRSGEKHAWLELVLSEGRNRQIRRLLGACDVSVLRLVRVAIGGLALGALPKAGWRRLTRPEVEALSGPPASQRP